MIRNFRIFLYFSKFALKTTFQQPVGSVFFLLGKFMRFGTYFLFVFYLLSNTKILAGYNMTQTLIFFLTFNIVDTLSQLLFREVYRFRPLVVNGELDAILIKPYHPFMRVLIGGVDVLDFISVIIYLGMLVFFVSQLHSLTALSIFIYLLLIINALIITTAFHIIVLALGIFTTEVDHTILIYRDLTRLGAFPIDIYAEPVKSLLTFVIPIGIMFSFPVKSLMGILSWNFIAISFAFSSILFMFSMYLWNNALKKYQSWGG